MIIYPGDFSNSKDNMLDRYRLITRIYLQSTRDQYLLLAIIRRFQGSIPLSVPSSSLQAVIYIVLLHVEAVYLR